MFLRTKKKHTKFLGEKQNSHESACSSSFSFFIPILSLLNHPWLWLKSPNINLRLKIPGRVSSLLPNSDVQIPHFSPGHWACCYSVLLCVLAGRLLATGQCFDFKNKTASNLLSLQKEERERVPAVRAKLRPAEMATATKKELAHLKTRKKQNIPKVVVN